MNSGSAFLLVGWSVDGGICLGFFVEREEYGFAVLYRGIVWYCCGHGWSRSSIALGEEANMAVKVFTLFEEKVEPAHVE